MVGRDDLLWLALAGLAHIDLAALGEMHRRWPSGSVALERVAEGGGDLRGVIPPSRRRTTAAEARQLYRDDICRTILTDLERCGATLLRTDAEPFGALLESDAGWPPVLTVRGPVPQGPLVAVVGMRKASPGGRRFASRLAADLTEVGLGVVSGMAFGIDRAAHEGALAAGGTTVAVLAGGVARPSPVSNADVAARILDSGGALVSHVPPEASAIGWRFPIRNRLIAGLSSAVVVVEAAASGGSLSTAAHAVRLGCPLFAVPGPPWSMHSAGTNALIADGALVCRGVDDVLPALGLEPAGRRRQSGARDDVSADLTDDERLVLEAVPFTPEPVPGIARAVSLPLTAVLAALGHLEQLDLVECPTPVTVVRVGP